MQVLGFSIAPRTSEESAVLVRKGLRYALLGLGIAIMALGLPVAFLPFVHIIGIMMVAAGLVIVLRNSRTARRKFIRAQRRHPNVFYPMRRLMRRKPEIVPVFWHLLLKSERLTLPRRYRFFRRLRRGLFRRSVSASGPSAA